MKTLAEFRAEFDRGRMTIDELIYDVQIETARAACIACSKSSFREQSTAQQVALLVPAVIPARSASDEPEDEGQPLRNDELLSLQDAAQRVLDFIMAGRLPD